MKRVVNLSIILIGLTAIISQIVLLREFFLSFYGNELSAGFVFAVWLAGGGAGSAILGRFSDNVKNKIPVFASCQILLAIFLPAAVLMTRLCRPFLGINLGEAVGLFPMIISGLVILTPISVTLGFMFSLAVRFNEEDRAKGAGVVYVLEAAGSMAGGLIAGFLLVRLLGPLEIMLLLCLLNLAAAIALIFRSKHKRMLLTIAVGSVSVIAFLWLFKGWDALDRYSMARQWPGYRLIESVNSIYGNVTVVERGGQVSFFNNGIHIYTIPDKESAEYAAHLALLEHPSPKDVLLIGGGAGGLAEEALKHHLSRLDYVELDPLIIAMAMRDIPAEYRKALEDPRVSISNSDGRFFVKFTKNRYDCVIINIGDPYTAQINRFYTTEFFSELKRILKEGGIVSFSVSSSENYINKELAEFLRSIYCTLKSAFEEVIVIPGDTAYFLASDRLGALTYDMDLLMSRRKERGIDLKYVREYYLLSKMSPQRISYINGILRKGINAQDHPGKNGVSNRINRDFKPISYYYDIIFWASRFKGSLIGVVLKWAAAGKIWFGLYAISALILLSGLFIRKSKKDFGYVLPIAVIGMGYAAMSLQIVILAAFQAIYGYLFYKIGIIVASFMVGLATGGFIAIRNLGAIRDVKPVFIANQVCMAVYSLALPVTFLPLAVSGSSFVLWWGSNIIFILLPFLVGLPAGFQFPLASKIYIGKGKGPGASGGLIYGADLFGSCLGALLTSAILIPVLGAVKTCFFASFINIAISILLLT